MNRFTIDLWVNNRFGVLNRITGLYAKRGYNIESIHAGRTEVSGVTKIEIVSTGDDYMRTQVLDIFYSKQDEVNGERYTDSSHSQECT